MHKSFLFPSLSALFTVFFMTLFMTSSRLQAEEFRPINITSNAETFSRCEPSDRYSLQKMYDGDAGTYACILDDTRTGKNENVCPPNAAAPVTCSFVLDFGEEKTLRGVRFVSRSAFVYAMASDVSAAVCSDAEGKENVRELVRNVKIPGYSYGNSAFITWETPVTARFLRVTVNDAWQKNLSYYWKDLQQDWCRRTGLPVAGDGSNFNVQIAEISAFDALPEDFPVKNASETAFPRTRLERDWLYQDCGMDVSQAFHSSENASYEIQLIHKVLKELKDTAEVSLSSVSLPETASSSETTLSPEKPASSEKPASPETAEKLEEELHRLAAQNLPGSDPAWKSLYFRACAVRRARRLAPILKHASQFLYVKHHIFGSTNGLVGKYDIPDEQVRDYTESHRPGSQLCLLTLAADGTVKNEVLLEKPVGTICYPSLSYDGKTLVFSMRENYETDSYHLYTMELNSRKVRQITFDVSAEVPLLGADGKAVMKEGKPVIQRRALPAADCEPAWLPDGRIVFTSTRGVQISDCWYRASGDIYACEADGTNIQRLTYDQLMTNLPQVLEDGRIVFTRWEYNDRSALYTHPLISMNPDGTTQTEYYGNNSMFPSSIIHANRIPGSNKIVGTISGHHTIYKGKLGIIDRTVGTQAGEGIEFINTRLDGKPGREAANVVPSDFNDMHIDIFGQTGPQYAYPFAFDEENFLAAFSPEGSPLTFGPLTPPLGAYFLTADGRRELLAFDPQQCAGGIIPVMERTVPPNRGNHVDLNDNFGTFYLQNVYFGPGLEGITPGTVKKLRVVALEYRPARMGYGHNGGECETGLCQTPISLNSGSWDVKHVLGEVDVEEDGSCYFRVPARTPVYFQLLDEKGYCVQTMRSWATLMNGEQFSCLGCHENKNDALPPSQRRATLAMRHPIQTPRRVDGSLHPLVERCEKASWLENVQMYLGVNAPKSLDADAPVEGFSYTQEIQPIFDRHCVVCHSEDSVSEKKCVTPCLTGEPAPAESIQLLFNHDVDQKRAYTRSYVELTTSGNPDRNPWMQWLKPRSRAVMLPPYHTGSCKSKVMECFEASHYGVQVSDVEKRTFACWLDLLIPFCGSYPQANLWTDAEKAEFNYYQQKRAAYAEPERETLLKIRDGKF